MNYQWRNYGPAAAGAQAKRGQFSSHIGRDGELGAHFWEWETIFENGVQNLKLRHCKLMQLMGIAKKT